MGPEGYGALLGEVSFTCSRVSQMRQEIYFAKQR